MPSRFVKVDFIDRLEPRVPPLVSQAMVGLACATLAVLARTLVDLVYPGAGPFALTFPFILFATLFARWGAGVGVLIFSTLFAWYYVLPVSGSFALENPSDGPRVIVSSISGGLIVGLAEFFRRVVRFTLLERDAIAEERRLLLAELDHRVKNNFAMVSGMIGLEMRSANGEVSDVLRAVRGRVESIARAHEALYRREDGVSQVAMRPYLNKLCKSLESAFFDGNHFIDAEVAEVSLPRDTAVAVGLVVNELCTNAAKHAFPEGAKGRIEVCLTTSDESTMVSVSDNGVGMPEAPTRRGSLGQGLVKAFAEQAGGHLDRVDVPQGTRFLLTLPLGEGRSSRSA